MGELFERNVSVRLLRLLVLAELNYALCAGSCFVHVGLKQSHGLRRTRAGAR